MSQWISIVGAAMVLGAFAALQFRRAHPEGRVYLLLNVLGSAALALAAGLEGLWAFVTLNTIWGLVSLRSLVRTSPAGDQEVDPSSGSTHLRATGSR